VFEEAAAKQVAVEAAVAKKKAGKGTANQDVKDKPGVKEEGMLGAVVSEPIAELRLDLAFKEVPSSQHHHPTPSELLLRASRVRMRYGVGARHGHSGRLSR
jgi:hypothetical protein